MLYEAIYYSIFCYVFREDSLKISSDIEKVLNCA